jgi:hypothetical protein
MSTDTLFLVPRGVPGLAPLQLDLTVVHLAESRVQEIGFLTPQKAPELMSLFNKANLDLARYLAELTLERVQAEATVNNIKSVVVLDRAVDILKAKGLTTEGNPAGSKDLRDAVLNGDQEYQKALLTLNVIETYVELIRNKMRVMENSYTGAKKIIGDGSSGPYNRRNPNLTGDSGSLEPGQTLPGGWVSPKY